MSPDSFHTRIRASLADPDLQIALDGNAERRLKGRAIAFTSLPDSDAVRQQARAIRAEVIANLDRHLEQFIAQASANGMIVHRAADAAAAVQTVLQICRSVGPSPLVAKSKSMLSEEIALNPALEAAGVRVVETDLGEYIVQLRGEPPAHLITPAVHLRRQQVGQLFAEKLGVPYTEDIPTMTNTARRTLRQVFLQAEIGISGVNFGVAESGSLVVLTNEGNGRMVTTLPRVHIALMGMERLLPSLDDLAVMLALLPRSATGQKMTVYASLIRGPEAQEDPGLPARQRHLILLDNGRSALRQSPLAEALYCIRCGACLNACPVFREIGGHAYVSIHNHHAAYPGPIGAILSPALFGVEEFGQLARASSLCGACKEYCPVGIDLPALLLRIRAGMVAPDGRTAAPRPNPPQALSWGVRAFTFLATHPRWFSLAQRLAGLGSRLLAPVSPWLRLPVFTGWGYGKDFPRPALRPFREMRPEQAETPPYPPQRKSTVGEGKDGTPGRETTVEETPPYPPQRKTTVGEGIERFSKELSALNCQVIVCAAAELPAQILAQLRTLNASQLHTWDDFALPQGLLDALRAGGIEIYTGRQPSARVGLSGVAAAAAETGTLLIPGGPGRPLTTSLLPDIHLAILPASRIKQNLAQVLHQSEAHSLPLAALVTGPSRTADIEMALTIGVHGPGQVIVFCLSDA